MRRDTRQRKHAMAGLRAISDKDRMLGTLVRVIRSGKQALDAVLLEMGRMVAERVMLSEREEIAGPDYYSSDPALQTRAHEDGSILARRHSRGEPSGSTSVGSPPRPRSVESMQPNLGSRRKGPYEPLQDVARSPAGYEIWAKS